MQLTNPNTSPTSQKLKTRNKLTQAFNTFKEASSLSSRGRLFPWFNQAILGVYDFLISEECNWRLWNNPIQAL